MRKIKFIPIALILVVLVAFTLGSTGVFGFWMYYGSAPQSITIELITSVLPWEGSDELPNDTEHGKNHVVLIDAILNGSYISNGQKVELGLNGGSDSYINSQIAERKDIWWRDADQLGSMDVWEDDKIANYFALNEATNNLSFMLVFPDDSTDTYYLYTTSVYLGERRNPSVPIGTYVYPVFRTILKLNAETGKWEATVTEIGYAPSKYYSNPILGLAIDPAFDTDNWFAGELGTNKNNAIYSAVGQTLQVHSLDKEKPVYYTFSTSSATNVRISVEDTSNAIISVYDSSNKLVKTTAGANGSQTLTFRTSRNAQYYIEVSGAEDCSVSITKV